MLIYNDRDREFSRDMDQFLGPDSIEDNLSHSGFIRKKSTRWRNIFICFLALLLVALAFAMWPDSNTNQANNTAEDAIDPRIIELSKHEQNANHIELINLLYSNTEPEFSYQVLPWLRTRESKGFAPYYYATARHLLITDQPYQALLYYSAAGLMARVDAARCTDRTSAGWVAFLESKFDGVREYMKTISKGKQSAGIWALNKEERYKDRQLPAWICLHGEKQQNNYVPYVAEELWQQERAEIRKAFEAYINTEDTSEQIAEAEPANG